METTSLGIGMHSTNMSAAGEMINKSISSANLAYGRKNNAKVAKFYEAVVTMLHSMAADDKLNLLAEYGDTGKLNRNHSNLDDVLAETIIINLPASELEALVKDVKTDEAALKKDIKTIRMKQKRKRIKTSSFNSNSFEDVYGKLSHAKNASQYAKLRKRLVGGFKVPKGMKTVYANLSREIKDLLRNYYDKIEVSTFAARMGIDITPDMKDRDVENSIINKTLLYVDLLVGKSKKKTNYGGAIVDRAPFDEILQLTTYAYVTGKPGLSTKEILKKRREIEEARQQARIRLRIESGHKFFNKRFSIPSMVGKNKLKKALDKKDITATGLKNPHMVLNINKNGEPELKSFNEIADLCLKYHIKFGKNESIEKITVRLDREISRQKKRAFNLNRRLDRAYDKTGNQKSVLGEQVTTYSGRNPKATATLSVLSNRQNRNLEKNIKDGFINYDDNTKKYTYTDKYERATNGKHKAGEEVTFDVRGISKLRDSKINIFRRLNNRLAFGKKGSRGRDRFENNVDEVIENKFKSDDNSLEELAESEKKANKEITKSGALSQLYDNLPVYLTKNITSDTQIEHAVPTVDVRETSIPISLVSGDIDEKYSSLSYVTPVLVTNKDVFSQTSEINRDGGEDKSRKISDKLFNFGLSLHEKNKTDDETIVSEREDKEKKRKFKKSKPKNTIPVNYLNNGAMSMKFNRIPPNDNKHKDMSLVQPVYVVNKEPDDKTYGWLLSEFPKYMLAMSNDVVAAPMGAGVITRPALMAMAGVSTGMAAAEDAMRLADAAMGGLMGLNTGGSGKAKSNITSFISGDSPNGLNDKNSFPEQVDIDWANKSFNVKPIPTYATGVRGEAKKDTVRRFSEKERNAPMAVGFSSHIVKFNRKLDGISGETDIGEAIKVYNVNESAGIGDNFTVGGKKTNLIELVNNMCNQLSIISERLKSTQTQSNNNTSSNTTLVQPNISLPVIEQSGTNNTPRLSSVGFTSSLDNILQGV